MNIVLTNYRVTSISIINHSTPNGEKNIQMNTHHEVAILESNKCASKCSLNLILADEKNSENEKTFGVKIEIEGIFKCENPHNVDADELSENCFRELLPFFRAHVSSAMASIGLPPVVIPLDIILQ